MLPSAPYSLLAHPPKRKRATKPPLPSPSFAPHACFVLGVDPGEHAGWALWFKDQLWDFGELSGLDYEAVKQVIRAALQLAEIGGVPCVMVIEKPPTHHAKRSFASLLGSGETRAAWRLAWVACKGNQKRMVRVEPNRWRGAVLPGWAGSSRAVIKPQELRVAESIVKQHSRHGVIRAVGAESAPAILIGRWGVRAGEVGAVLGGRKR
jgi:hypothetical protein